MGPLVAALGFLLAFRIDASARYWTDVVPMIVAIALGMGAAVSPLTTAVLTSVDARHIGAASGINTAVARTGSLIATALLGPILAAGSNLLSAFHTAMLVAAVACAAASLSAFALVGRTSSSAADTLV